VAVREDAVVEKVLGPAYDPQRNEHDGFFWGTGRRKTSVARVRMRPGTGRIEVNGKVYTEYLPVVRQREEVLAPLKATNMLGKLDIFCNVRGGGVYSQAAAVKMGIARALVVMDANLHRLLRSGGFLTRDQRMAERKKYGLHGARRGCQFSKR